MREGPDDDAPAGADARTLEHGALRSPTHLQSGERVASDRDRLRSPADLEPQRVAVVRHQIADDPPRGRVGPLEHADALAELLRRGMDER